jgi:L-iditol 2-dehydrogenase
VGVPARWIGVGEVVVVDPNERRLELARRFGLQDAWTPDQLAPRAETLRADVLIDCSGSVQALNPALGAVRPAGTVVVVGMAREGSVALDLDHLQRRELTVVGSFRYANCFPEAIALAASGLIPLEAVITSRYPLQKTALALTAARRDPGELKSLVLVG